MTRPLDPFSEVVDQARRWTPDWYGWLDDLETRVTEIETYLLLVRVPLTANTTFYVARTVDGGSDSTGLGSASAPWATLQFAYSSICATYDFKGFTVTIQILDGEYNAGFIVGQPWTGGGRMTIQGNVAAPTAVFFNITTGGSTAGNFMFTDAVLPGILTFRFIKMQTSVAAAACISVQGRGTVFLDTIEFGPCTSWHVACFQPGAVVQFTGGSTCTFSGAQNSLYSAGGVIQMFGPTTWIMKNRPNFSSSFALASGSSARVDTATMTFVDQAGHTRQSVTGTTALGNQTITVLPAGTTALLTVGMAVTGANITAGSVIASINTGANTVTMNLGASAAGAATVNFEIATGARFNAQLQGLINTNGGAANYFPGDTAGTANAAQFALYV